VSYLLDTNVVSEAMREVSDPKVMAWLEKHEADCFLSVITLGELEKGIELLPSGSKKRRLKEGYGLFLEAVGGRILDVDASVARRWAILTGSSQRAGRRLSVLDSLIEATALHWNLTLVTRNTADFAEVEMVNPWG
jgi:predicted nucleic acid-binding protein